MPRIQRLLPFLRPFAAPRSASCQAFRFSTASRLRADGPPGAASKHPAAPHPTTGPSRTTLPPTPSTPEAATRAADLAAAEAAIESDNPNPASSKPVLPSGHISQTPSAPSTSSPTPLQTPNPQKQQQGTEITVEETKLVLGPAKYHVERTRNNNFPVFTDYKRGGNLRTTVVRRVTGDVHALKDELRLFLGKTDDEVHLTQVSRQVIVKGHHKQQVLDFLSARGF
ncbi:uncharacterized protein EI97DRAFT_431724 [Westerdykella ornata]|uniref:Large ribosomal subunit protein mL49 n=1 Tax=Westerdykella ornata TaxID=318751 RepID=A0A6A6JQ39_WESOR|nr:uncharacterized protein EI97DRAFT_431724 [Westerdykella ornata]KAF2278497.1 hypothetical protein EI97DRAFT_431724 [Westerdykella ornata]